MRPYTPRPYYKQIPQEKCVFLAKFYKILQIVEFGQFVTVLFVYISKKFKGISKDSKNG